MTLKRNLYVLAGLAIIIGLYGFGVRLFVGERGVNYGSYVTWGLWVAMYLFFAGVATGAFMLATLDHLFEVPLFKGTGKYALWGAMVAMPAALIIIGMDLGHMTRIWKVYLQPNFTSLMAQLVWGYTLFTLVIVASLWLTARQPNTLLTKTVMAIGLFLAVFMSGGVGALLGVNVSRSSWHSSMLPAQFPIFSLTSGVALLLIAAGWFMTASEQRTKLLRVLSVALIVLLGVKAYYLWTDYSLAVYGGAPDAVAAVDLVLFGPYSWAFWALQLVVGMIIPVILLAQPKFRQNGWVAGLMGVFVLIGFAVARANIIFPALSIPELEGLRSAFTGPHLNFDYFPSFLEWSVTVGVIGLATLAFLVGIDRLPRFSGKEMTE